MKKLITVVVIIALTLTMAVSLTGCGKIGKCEQCGQNEHLVKYTFNGIWSEREPIWVCSDCYKICKLFYGS